MQFLRSFTPFAQIQKAAFWKSLKPMSFFRNYLLTNIFSTRPLTPSDRQPQPGVPRRLDTEGYGPAGFEE